MTSIGGNVLSADHRDDEDILFGKTTPERSTPPEAWQSDAVVDDVMSMIAGGAAAATTEDNPFGDDVVRVLLARIEPILGELKANAWEERGHGQATRASLEDLRRELGEMRSQLGTMSRSPKPPGITTRLDPEPIEASRPTGKPILMIAIGIVLMSWGLVFYVKSGRIELALAVLIGANLAGWATFLMAQRNR